MTHPPSEPIFAPGFKIQFLIEGDATNESISMFRCEIAPGSTTPAPHSHDGFDETVYGISGTLNFVVDGKATKLGAGDVVHVPRGVVHGFGVTGDEPAVILAISTPGIFSSDYFREIGQVMAAAAGGPPDREAMFEVMRRHGLTPALPAGA